MDALILNSGMGTRMGDLTANHPKCMTILKENETILSRQLKLLEQNGVKDIVMTTGLFDKILVDYCHSLSLSLKYTFVKNTIYDQTNYIYSIYLAREYLHNDIILVHGDLVFENSVFEEMLSYSKSCMAISSTNILPPKDFKAVIENGMIKKIGIEFFDNAVAAQPLYKLNSKDWMVWLKKIISFCENGQTSCYAENAFNEVSDRCSLYPIDFKEKLCAEIDTKEDLSLIRKKL